MHKTKLLVWALAISGLFQAQGGETRILVDAGKVLLTREQPLVGANIEDLNFQLYGGLYSQLIHGEAFEEHVDPSDIFGLSGSQRMAVWVLLNEAGEPFLSLFSGRGPLPKKRQPIIRDRVGPPASKENYAVGPLSFNGGVILPSEMRVDQRRQFLDRATGESQTSRHWRKVSSGSAKGRLTLVRQGVFTGKQAQEIRFLSGEGEFGVDNAGLFRRGIPFESGKPYEGTIRIKSDTPREVEVSLRNGAAEVLDRKTLVLKAAPGLYQPFDFILIPKATVSDGRFSVTLREPGSITVDYAFLQAGEWGRYKGLPVRKEFAEGLIAMGAATGRYNGSMVNRCPDGREFYKWKKMIGPRDERPPYEGFFNPYASHGFSVFEWMDFCQAAGIWPLVGFRTDEKVEDMADLVDYCLGGPETTWGARRIQLGHPKPYFLKAIQIGNEEPLSPAYFECARAAAAAIWSKNRSLDVVLSLNVGRGGGEDEFIKLVRWCQEQSQGERLVLDSHYGSRIDHADTDLAASVGLNLHRRLANDLPGYKLRLWPMEENGDRCTWARGLAHAHNLNTLNRMPLSLERAGTANTFQAWDLPLIWDQGRIHFTATQLVFQPSYHVDRMFADEWLPVIVEAQCESAALDVLAKKSRDGKTLSLYLVNISEQPIDAAIDLKSFSVKRASATRLAAPDLKAKNLPEAPDAVAPRELDLKWAEGEPHINLPAQSFTVVRLGS